MAEVAANRISSDNQFIHYQTTSCNQETEYQRDVWKLVDLLSKLNPLAKEFFPSSYTPNRPKSDDRPSADAPVFVGPTDYHNKSNVSNNGNNNKDSSSDGSSNNQPLNRKRTNGYNQGRNRMNDRVRRLEREESIRQTVYVSDIDHHVVDCRVCGDLHSTLRFAFIEFDDDESARAALTLGGAMLGSHLVTQSEVKHFFEQVCGEVSRLRLLGDNLHSTWIAFVEFVQAESAILALNVSGMVLGSLPVRISPSKTPVRPRIP